MGIKSQRDVKKEHEDAKKKVPRSMEKLARAVPSSESPVKPAQKEPTIEDFRIAFNNMANDIHTIGTILKSHDEIISKLTGDLSRLTSLEEERYIELATAINNLSQRVELIDVGIPAYIDNAFKEYFEETDADKLVDDEESSTSD